MSFQDHLSCCDHSLIQCVHSQCKQDVKRSLLAQHLETECLYRQVLCILCRAVKQHQPNRSTVTAGSHKHTLLKAIQ